MDMEQNPAELDDWLGDLNPQSKIVIPSAYATHTLREATVGNTFQFERLGMYSLLFNDSNCSTYCWLFQVQCNSPERCLGSFFRTIKCLLAIKHPSS